MTKEHKQIMIPIICGGKNASKWTKWSSIIQEGGHRVESCPNIDNVLFSRQAKLTHLLAGVGVN